MNSGGRTTRQLNALMDNYRFRSATETKKGIEGKIVRFR